MKSDIRRRTGRGSRAGVALITVLITLTSLLVILAVFQQQSVRVTTEERTHIDDRRAFYLAETALSEAMLAVRARATGEVGSRNLPAYFGGGVFWVEAFATANPAQTRLVATAMYGSGRAALEAVVEMAPEEALFKGVLNSKETLTLNQGVLIDSYKSKDGSYASQVTNLHNGRPYALDNGDVLSNQGIVFNANTYVFGDATPGPGYSVTGPFTGGNPAYLSGSNAPAPEPFTFPPVNIPPVPISGNMIPFERLPLCAIARTLPPVLSS
jgi:hypothetical protein